MRLKGRNSRSRLETKRSSHSRLAKWDWKKEILVLVLKCGKLDWNKTIWNMRLKEINSHSRLETWKEDRSSYSFLGKRDWKKEILVSKVENGFSSSPASAEEKRQYRIDFFCFENTLMDIFKSTAESKIQFLISII